jgi:hypothetical protein
MIFNHFDADGSGILDYREFVVGCLGEEAGFKGEVRGKKKPNQQEVRSLIEQVRNLIMRRGAKGIIGIQRIFKITDDNGNGQLEAAEFTKAIR